MKSMIKTLGISALAVGALSVAGMSPQTVDAAEVTYTVQPGDTLYNIASKTLGNGENYNFIASENGISNPNLIYVGQSLTYDDGLVSSDSTAVPAPIVDDVAAQPEVKQAPVAAPKAVEKSSVSTSAVPEYVLQVVESEAGPGYQEKANVFSVIQNRVNSGAWGGSDYMSVVKASGQFQVTWNGMADNAQVSGETRQAVADVLSNGVTTSAQSFHASGDGVTNVFH